MLFLCLGSCFSMACHLTVEWDYLGTKVSHFQDKLLREMVWHCQESSHSRAMKVVNSDLATGFSWAQEHQYFPQTLYSFNEHFTEMEGHMWNSFHTSSSFNNNLYVPKQKQNTQYYINILKSLIEVHVLPFSSMYNTF